MLLTLLMKNNALSHFIAINTCHSSETAYNAQPLRRHNGLQPAAQEVQEASEPPEKLLKKKLTPKEESVIYATSQQEA
ncbi:hypothetical protein, partial [Erwinia rhapontici]|uniref:hypothetical protein n=1 Tax=Erwinia rhapontici TaxID=55212 RepID=UPI001A931C34